MPSSSSRRGSRPKANAFPSKPPGDYHERPLRLFGVGQRPVYAPDGAPRHGGRRGLGRRLAACRASWAAGLRGRINQSVCLWCYGGFLGRVKMDLDQFAAACAKLGLKSIELTTPDQWPTLKKHGLICAMTPSHGIAKGLNRLENHDECLAKIRQRIDATSDAGFPNVITLSGNRQGMDDQEGLKNCVIGLKKIAGYAERKKVTVCLELLNSAVDHKDYMADSTKWCVELAHRVGSPRVKILYDIYHAGMMKEDVLADIRNHADCFAHYHTGGVPGRQRDRRHANARLRQDHAGDCRHRLHRLRRPGVRSPSGPTR